MAVDVPSVWITFRDCIYYACDYWQFMEGRDTCPELGVSLVPRMEYVGCYACYHCTLRYRYQSAPSHSIKTIALPIMSPKRIGILIKFMTNISIKHSVYHPRNVCFLIDFSYCTKQKATQHDIRIIR